MTSTSRTGSAIRPEILEPREVPLGGPRAMTVRRTLPQRERSLVGAWCFLDYYGPDRLSETAPMRVPRHPHTGLATVSWLFSGEVDHLDSGGHWARVKPGELVVMNAGQGITHSEFSTEDTTILHGVQLWYAFPEAHRFAEPSLEHYVPELIQGQGWQGWVFLGTLLGSTSPVKTYIPLSGAEIRLEPGASLTIELPTDHEHGVQYVAGDLTINGEALHSDGLAFLAAGTGEARVTAGSQGAHVMLLGGEPLGEQIVMWWNFVGRSHEEVAAFRAAYQAEMGYEDAATATPLWSEKVTKRGKPATLQFGDFPPGQPAALPAPALPTSRMKPRG